MDHKVFNDPVHSQIKLHPLLVAIVDTPEFQRLRRIKALGACSYVFPGAEHSRFEHSLGVAYLAKKLLNSLCANAKEYKRELAISDRDQFCVQIAALCHDLGAGPLSFVFDRYVKDSMLQSDAEQFGDSRQRAVLVFERMYKENGLEEKFVKWMYLGEDNPGSALDTDLTFIKELILGRPLSGQAYKGRQQLFFYKIIARDCIIDIHKWDYLARNSRGLNVPCGLDPSFFSRFLESIQVDKDLEVLMIRDKESVQLHPDLCTMYFERQMLHRRACAHKTVIAIEYMLLDLLKKADDVIVYAEQNPITLKQCVETGDVAAFICLDDTIITTIRRDAMVKRLSNSDKVLEMWTCLEKRKLYRLGPIQDCPMDGTRELVNSTSALEEVADCADCDTEPDVKDWIKKNTIIHVACFDYGLHGQDPLRAAYFYTKDKPGERKLLTEEQFSRLLPRDCTEQQVFYYLRDDSRRKDVNHAFATWCQKKKEFTDREATEDPEQANTLPGSCAAKKELEF